VARQPTISPPLAGGGEGEGDRLPATLDLPLWQRGIEGDLTCLQAGGSKTKKTGLGSGLTANTC
jgi:hypothetical protein